MLLYATAFDYGGVAAFAADPDWSTESVSGWAIVEGKNAPTALRITGSNVADLAVSVSAATDTLIVQAAVRFEEFRWDDHFVSLWGGAEQGVALQVTRSGGMVLRDHDDQDLDEAPGGTFLPGVWHYVELKAQYDTRARVQVRIDGTLIFDAYDVDTKCPSGFDTVRLAGERTGTTWSELVVLDGAGVANNDFLGLQTRVDGDSIYLYEAPGRGPNPIGELIGYTNAREAGGVPTHPRPIWRMAGATLTDDPLTQSTFLTAGEPPTSVTLLGDAENFSPGRWSGATLVFVECQGADRVIRSADPWVAEPIKFLFNKSAEYDLILEHDSETGPADSRFILPAGFNLVIGPGQGCFVLRDPVSARWRATQNGPISSPTGTPSDIVALL